MKLMRHLMNLDLSFHRSQHTGELVSAFSKTDSLRDQIKGFIISLTSNLMRLCFTMFYLGTNFFPHYFILLLDLGVWYIDEDFKIAKTIVKLSLERAAANRECDAAQNNLLLNYEPIIYNDATNLRLKRYEQALTHRKEISSQVTLSYMSNYAKKGTVIQCFIFVILLHAANNLILQEHRPDSLFTLYFILNQFADPLVAITSAWQGAQRAWTNSIRIKEIFLTIPRIRDSLHPRSLPQNNGSLQFKSVHFEYEANYPVLRGVDFRCEPGTTTGLVGKSGEGKSTIASLLMRGYEATKGTIEVGSEDIRLLALNKVRKSIGFVSQDVSHLDDTVLENVRLSQPYASDQQVIDACMQASIHEDILKFPDGYKTRLGERGLRLSGGQKQRLAFA
ncbi:MAG: hypothetical protein Q9162_007938 [Coniocarpon cinnabarinum]